MIWCRAGRSTRVYLGETILGFRTLRTKPFLMSKKRPRPVRELKGGTKVVFTDGEEYLF